MSGLTVVCVDPDGDARDATSQALSDAGHEVHACESVAAAVETLDGVALDCLVTEYALPDGTGLDLAARLRDRSPDTPAILFTTEGPDRVETDRREDVVVEYLPKEMPDARSSLVRLVENVVAERSQVGYPLPPDEDERLAALARYDRPGMEAVETFDRLTELAKSHFGVDVAFVGLVDAHEERFLACSGAGWETLTREDTVCTHAILENEPLVVEDVASDPRFADNDRLAELGIRAYAGVPLRTPRGTAIGSFCLTHDEPRAFSEADLADLQRFADEAMEQLELRRRLADADGEEAPGADGSGHSCRPDTGGGVE